MSEHKLFEITYGSKLYGTSTADSDTDNKVVYLPPLGNLLLNKKLSIYKERVDAEGNKLGVNDTMPANGVETEYFPVQTFVHDFVVGQTYAIEIAFAYLKDGPPKPGIMYTSEKPLYDFMKELVENFSNAEVYSMVGFAMKQTFDYVQRGDRLNAAKKVLEVVDELMLDENPGQHFRLDDKVTVGGLAEGESFLDHIAKRTGLETEVLTGGHKPQNSLKLNGRNYTESTTLSHFREQVLKMIKQFGERSNRAADDKVDYKSLSHAVRVYQQAIELLDTGAITFPRPNADHLLNIKQGRVPLDTVKDELILLDDLVQIKIEQSTMRKKTPELQKAAEEWLLTKLRGFYELDED